MKPWLKAKLDALNSNKTLKTVVAASAVSAGLLLASDASAAIVVTDITGFATDAVTAANTVVNEYGKTFMLPVAVISVLWILGKRFLWRSV